MTVSKSVSYLLFSVYAENAATGEILTASVSRQRRTALLSIDESLTPIVEKVSPSMGGTAGGTELTIYGSGFGNEPDHVTVSISDSECQVLSVTETKIICQTGPLLKGTGFR